MRAITELAQNLIHEAGKTLEEIPAGGIVAISVMRDEAWRLPFWLAYYRWFGVDHFIIIDNESTDQTAEILRREPDVTLISSRGSYRGPNGYDRWMGAVLAASPPERWNLIVDADEFLVAAPWRRGGLRRTVSAMEDEDVDVAHALMVDCYPEAYPFKGPTASAIPWRRAPWFDAGPYAKWNARKRRPKLVYHGVRQRIFWKHWRWQRHIPKLIRKWLAIGSPPFIVKAPLFRKSAARGVAIHRASNPADRRAKFICYILHYKFDMDLEQKSSFVVAQDLHYKDEYLPFRQFFLGAQLSLKGDHSRQFTGYNSLVSAQLCRLEHQHAAGPDADVGIETAWREIRECTGKLSTDIELPSAREIERDLSESRSR